MLSQNYPWQHHRRSSAAVRGQWTAIRSPYLLLSLMGESADKGSWRSVFVLKDIRVCREVFNENVIVMFRGSWWIVVRPPLSTPANISKRKKGGGGDWPLDWAVSGKNWALGGNWEYYTCFVLFYNWFLCFVIGVFFVWYSIC